MLEEHPIPNHPRFQNLTGMRFGRLLVVSFAGKRIGRSVWNCLCDCGQLRTVFAQPLKAKITTSCVCLHRQITSKRNTTHNLSGTPEHRTWKAMLTRCANPRTKNAKDYVGRGITVCEQWLHSFALFLQDMGPKPSPAHSLDRIDVNGNYEPGNCRWATSTQQTRNARSNRRYTYNGETLCLSEWVERTGISRSALSYRLDHGWTPEKAFTTPMTR